MPEVIIDQRELRSPVAKGLDRLGCDMVFKTLEVGDYVASDRVGIERKTGEDLLKSWVDEKKLFGQIKDLCDAYERPVLIVEGGLDQLFTLRNIHPASVQGMLNTIAVSFRCPTLYSLNAVETAEIICRIAEREQIEEKRPVTMHGKRSHLSPPEIKEYVVSAIPDIGPVIARNLLTHFDNVQTIFTAPKEKLMEVDEVGPETADMIRNVVGGSYAEDCKAGRIREGAGGQ